MNDHDLLIRIDERVQKIDKCLGNHLQSHIKINIMAWGAALSAIAALIVALVL